MFDLKIEPERLNAASSTTRNASYHDPPNGIIKDLTALVRCKKNGGDAEFKSMSTHARTFW